MNLPFKFPPLNSEIVISLLFLTFNLPSSFETDNSTKNHTHVQNQTSAIHIRSSPPTKSLLSQLFNAEGFLGGNGVGAGAGGHLKTSGGPLRQSYIAFEQAYPEPPRSTDPSYSYLPTGPSYDDVFQPSGFETSNFYSSKLQNAFPNYYDYQPPQPQQQRPIYYPGHHHPQAPPPPPPPPQPFLRLVRIPGDLKLTVTGGGGRNDFEVHCEFPPFLLTVQQIYWHFIPHPSSFLSPYGTFYDLRNGFAPRVTVTPVSKWKSILRVRDYTPDDFGTYRCVSTAILPDEPEHPRPNYSPPIPPYAVHPSSPPRPPQYFLNFPHDSIELRSSESRIEASHEGGEQLASYEKGDKLDLMSSSSKPIVTRERKVKFLDRSKRDLSPFGVFAPFFKPHYGLYRVYKEIVFSNDAFGAGSDVVENTISTSKENQDRVGNKGVNKPSGTVKGNSSGEGSDKQSRKNGGRRFDASTNIIFKRDGRVMF